MSSLNSVVGIVNTALLIPTATLQSALVVELQLCVTLVVCNLLVIVTFLFRCFMGSDMEDALYTTQISTATGTEVDIESPLPWLSTPPLPENFCTRVVERK